MVSALRSIWIGLWLIAIGMGTAVGQTAPKRILIVQSQPAGDLFHSAIVAHLTAALPKQTPRVQLFVEALDASRLDLWRKPAFLSYLRLKYGSASFDIVVTVGSPAAQAMRGPGAPMAVGIPWVVVNAGPGELDELKKLPNVIPIGNVGVDFVRNMALVKELMPQVKHLLVIGKAATQHIEQDLQEAMAKVRGHYASITRLDEGRDTVLLERLKAAPPHTAVFLAGWLDDASGQPLQGKELLGSLVPGISQPVFTSWDFVLGEGIVGGKMIATEELGARAGQVVGDLLNGRSVADFAQMAAISNHYIFDYRALRKHGISESLLPQDSAVRYRPRSLAQSNPMAFYAGLAVIVTLAATLAVTVFLLRIRRRAAQESARNERHFRMLFEANPVGLLVFDTERMEILASNHRVEEILGAQAAVTGSPVSALAFIPKADRQDFANTVQHYRERARSHVPLRRLLRSDGQVVVCEMDTHAIDYFGKPARLVMINDVTQRIEAENKLADQNEFLTTLLNTIPQPVFWKSDDGRYLGGNQALTQVFGRPLDEIVGHTLQELALDADLERYIQSDKNLLQNPGRQQFEDRMIFADNQCHDVLIHKATYRHQGTQTLGLAGTITDISHIKQIEARLREANIGLEHKVAERTSELARANEELQNAMQQLVQREKLAALGKLVAGVSHELNTPLGNSLTVVSSLSERLLRFQQEFTQGTLRRSGMVQFLDDTAYACSMLERNTQRAAELVASFKLVAIDQASARRRPFDLADLVQKTLLALSPMLQGAPVRVETDIPEGLRFDSYPGALEQIITNLLQNAMVHGLENRASLRIAIRARAEDGTDGVLLQLEDNGIGMDAQTIRQAFDPFFTTRLGQGGSGLGLYIVYSLVSGMLGGAIELDSGRGNGTRFSIRMPKIAPSKSMDHDPT